MSAPRKLRFEQGLPRCAKCLEWLLNSRTFLVEACSSVAIETGDDPEALRRRVVEHYHARGHQQEGDAA